MTWHLSSRHNMECTHTIPWSCAHHCPFITAPWYRGCAQHGHLSSRHNMECDHTTTWDYVPHGHLSPHHNVGCGHTTKWDCAPHRHLLPNHDIDVSRNMGIYHHTTIWDVEMPSREIAPQIARACARKGAGEVTPKGLYFREGRVDERSEIYPV